MMNFDVFSMTRLRHYMEWGRTFRFGRSHKTFSEQIKKKKNGF